MYLICRQEGAIIVQVVDDYVAETQRQLSNAIDNPMQDNELTNVIALQSNAIVRTRKDQKLIDEHTAEGGTIINQ